MQPALVSTLPRRPRRGAARAAASLLTVLLAVLLAVAPAAAQEPADAPADAPVHATDGARDGTPRGTFGETVDVRVIDVEVVVTDDEGRRVTGLGRDDFRLLVNGRETPVAFFDEVWEGRYREPAVAQGAAGAQAAAAASGETGETAAVRAPQTRYLLILDDYFTRPAQRNQVLRKLREELHLLAPQDRFAAIAYDGRRLTVLCDWTDSLAEMDVALDAAMERGGWAAYREQVSARDNPERLARVIVDQVERTYSAVAAALRTFADAPGRRVALLVAGGWPYDPAYADAELDLAVGRSRLFDTRRPLQRLADLANAAGYTLYPIDAPGAEGGAGPSAEFGDRDLGERFGEALRENNREVTLQLLADETGGEAQLDGRRLSALARAVEDTRSYYWLGFEYRRQGDGERRQIRVEVTRPGLKVRARGSFLDVSPIIEGALTAERALLLDSDDEPTLQVELGEPQRAGRGKVQQPFAVRIPFDQVTVGRGPRGPRVNLELRVAVEDGKGGRSDLTTLPLHLDLAPGMVERGFAYYDAAVKIRRQRHVLVFTLTDQATGLTLVARHEVDPR